MISGVLNESFYLNAIEHHTAYPDTTPHTQTPHHTSRHHTTYPDTTLHTQTPHHTPRHHTTHPDTKLHTQILRYTGDEKRRNTTLSKPRTGRSRKINDRTARKLVRTVEQRPQTTHEELKDDLKPSGIQASKHTISRAPGREGLCSRTPHRTPLLKKHHVKARLKYANDHLNKPAVFWNSVLWSDETKIKLIGRNSTNHVWRQQNEQYKPQCTYYTVKFGRGLNHGVGMFQLIREWPSQSSDMNPIENLWRELKLKIQKRGPNNITELKEISIEEWNKITPETCKRLVVNYYKRLEAIINNKGYATKY
ncbi:Transposase Tc1-like [Trinorchestia longiramus]|nr:Transposase Tc1-like [Trinorchestia longiramus]